MLFSEKIEELNKFTKQHDCDVKILKKDFETYIKDQTIALPTRCKVFIEAPEQLNNHLDKCPDEYYKTIGKGLQFFMDQLIDCNIEDDYYVNLKEFVNSILYQDNTIDLEMVKLNLKANSYTDEQLTITTISFLEEILDLNLASFQADSLFD